jgi:RNA polymerase sigma-70 factor (ECF subfamily)
VKHFDEPPYISSSAAAAPPPIADTNEDFRKDLLGLIPFLRAFSRSLCGDRELADDLAQEALAKAWQSRDTFRAGSNLKAWLFTILRNQFYSDRRRAWRQAPWDDAAAERMPVARGEQIWAVQLSDTARALRGLPAEQREALILVGAGGFSYEDAARISNCAVGTVKSRVARARKALSAALEGNGPLSSEPRPAGGDATNEIMAQLERLAPLDAPESEASNGERDAT